MGGGLRLKGFYGFAHFIDWFKEDRVVVVRVKDYGVRMVIVGS